MQHLPTTSLQYLFSVCYLVNTRSAVVECAVTDAQTTDQGKQAML